MLSDLTVVVPARNAEQLIDDCLESVARAPARARSSSSTGVDRRDGRDGARARRPRALRRGARPAGGARGSAPRRPSTPLRRAGRRRRRRCPRARSTRLLDEFVARRLHRAAGRPAQRLGPGLLGPRARLPSPHRPQQGLVRASWRRSSSATRCCEHDFDERFTSGEDIDLRWRLRRAGARIGVSQARRSSSTASTTTSPSRGASGWPTAQGLGRMVARPRRCAHGLLVGLPLAACVRGDRPQRSPRRQPRWIPYFVCFAAGNYVGMLRRARERRAHERRAPVPGPAASCRWSPTR